MNSREVREAAIAGDGLKAQALALVYIGDRLDELGGEVNKLREQPSLAVADALTDGLSAIAREIAAS